jgi:5-methylcytosine-specific restriction protein B
LKYYPDINASALSLITEGRDVISKSGIPNVLDCDLFDMFSHWMVAEKKYFQPEVINLAPPFSEMFANKEEAEWAFDLLRETSERLGITGADDPLAAFTLRKSSGDILIRLNYCHWLVHGFAGRLKSLKSMTIAVSQEIVDLPTLYKGVFTQTEGKPDVFLYTLPIDAVRPFEGSLRKTFDETLDYIADKFRGWEKSPYHDRANPQIAEAIFDLDKRSQLFRDGISSVEEEGEIKGVQYWKIAPERNGRLWPKWRDEGFVSIGWNELGDLSGINRDEFEVRRDNAIINHPNWTEDGCEQVWKFANLQIGDRIIANRGTSQVLGIGTVTGPYYYVPDVEHGHRFPVKWDDTILREISEPGWRRSIISLEKEKFERILGLPAAQIKANPEHSQTQIAEETGFAISKIRSWVKAIERKGEAILYGPPGTGKTFMAEQLAQHLIGGGDGFIDTVQFHPAYAYEDFIQGIRPKTRSDGGLEYPMLPGRFLNFCERASEKNGICVLIIDEINRANLSRVFGELMYLLEYRDKSINLAGGEQFQIPSNIRIIGTMNTADRSIALVDHALRRRFAFLELYPDMTVLRHYHKQTGIDVEGLIGVLERLNQRIENPHYAVGISYFLRNDLTEQIEDIWTMEIEPYLNEYFFDHLDWAREFSWIKVKPTILS